MHWDLWFQAWWSIDYNFFLCISFNRNSWVVEKNWLFFSVWFTTIASHPLLKSLNVRLLNVTWVGHKTHNIWFSIDRIVIKWQPKVWFQFTTKKKAAYSSVFLSSVQRKRHYRHIYSHIWGLYSGVLKHWAYSGISGGL